MKQYLELMNHVYQNGADKGDRTGTGTRSLFGYQTRYDLRDGFPLVTTKKTYLRAIIEELLWFISGETNIEPLVKKNVRIWNEWPYALFAKSSDYRGESMDAFIERIKTDHLFAQKHGDLGPVYGKQWRDFGGVDQLINLIESIKTNPDSRRHIISAWNPTEVDAMALPPCHTFIQFYVIDGVVSCQLYQRSADIFLGVPFNIASYALLLLMVAQVTGNTAGEFVHTIGDAHIYHNHFEQVQLQLSREPLPLPEMVINPNIKDITKFTIDDFHLVDYQSHPGIKAPIAI